MHRPSCAPRQWLAPRRSLSDGGSMSRTTCCASHCSETYPGPHSSVAGAACIRAGEPWYAGSETVTHIMGTSTCVPFTVCTHTYAVLEKNLKKCALTLMW